MNYISVKLLKIFYQKQTKNTFDLTSPTIINHLVNWYSFKPQSLRVGHQDYIHQNQLRTPF